MIKENEVMPSQKDSIDKGYITGLVKYILDNNHTNPQKKTFREYPDRINMACPICGDSSRVASKKRGNLYFKNMMYICFNDDSCSRSFTRLLDTFNVQMDIEKKIQMYEHIERNIDFKSEEDISSIKLDKMIPIEELTSFFSTNVSYNICNLRPLEKGSVVDSYLKSRKVYNAPNIYQAEYYITPKWKQPVMVFLNMMGDKVISMQVRNLLDGDKRFFKIYDFTKVYDMMHPDEPVDEQEGLSYNKLSHFFNIFNIDFTDDITLFEGYMDSLFLPNSIGQIGVNTDITFLLNEDGIDLRFIYDNDKTGFNKSERMLQDGHKVFLWNKFFLDLLKSHKGNRTEMAKRISGDIKDFNKLAMKFKSPVYLKFDLTKYFSNDKLDKLYFLDLVDLVKMIP